MLDAYRGQKKVLDPLKLELQMVGSYHMGTGNWTSVLCQEQQVLLTIEPFLQPPKQDPENARYTS